MNQADWKIVAHVAFVLVLCTWSYNCGLGSARAEAFEAIRDLQQANASKLTTGDVRWLHDQMRNQIESKKMAEKFRNYLPGVK